MYVCFFHAGDGIRARLVTGVQTCALPIFSNLFFRFMSRYVFGYTATIETYLVDLGHKFGEETTPAAGR